MLQFIRPEIVVASLAILVVTAALGARLRRRRANFLRSAELDQQSDRRQVLHVLRLVITHLRLRLDLNEAAQDRIGAVRWRASEFDALVLMTAGRLYAALAADALRPRRTRANVVGELDRLAICLRRGLHSESMIRTVAPDASAEAHPMESLLTALEVLADRGYLEPSGDVILGDLELAARHYRDAVARLVNASETEDQLAA